VQYHAEDASEPGLTEVIDKLIAATWKAPDAPGLSGEVQRAIDMVALYRLMTLAANESAPGEVRAIAFSRLSQLRDWNPAATANPEMIALHRFAVAEIKHFETNPREIGVPRPPAAPPGMPIGEDDRDFVVW
jgi:hypothetical protein